MCKIAGRALIQLKKGFLQFLCLTNPVTVVLKCRHWGLLTWDWFGLTWPCEIVCLTKPSSLFHTNQPGCWDINVFIYLYMNKCIIHVLYDTVWHEPPDFSILVLLASVIPDVLKWTDYDAIPDCHFGPPTVNFLCSLLQFSFDDNNFGRHPGGVQHPSSGGQHPIQSQEHVSTVVIVPALHNDRQIQIL